MLTLLAATTNKHKVQEFQFLLHDLSDRLSITSINTIPNFPELVEDGTSFEENAVMKAVQASAFADTAVFADDSGLVVEALNGEPGIYSSRYAGPNASDEQKIQKLLNNMNGITNRRAKFVCVIAIAYRGKKVVAFTGEIHGLIANAPAGENGFGYDPVFIPDGYSKSFAELPPEIKDSISHRANAMKLAADYLRSELDKADEFLFV